MISIRAKIFASFLTSMLVFLVVMMTVNISNRKLNNSIVKIQNLRDSADDILLHAGEILSNNEYYYSANENRKMAITQENDFFVQHFDHAIEDLLIREDFKASIEEITKYAKKIKENTRDIIRVSDNLAKKIDEHEAVDLLLVGENNETQTSDLKKRQKALLTEIDDLNLLRNYHLKILELNVLEVTIETNRISEKLSKEFNDLLERSDIQKKIFNAAVVISMVVSLVLAYSLTSRITTALKDLILLGNMVVAGDLQVRSKIKTKDELGYLGGVLNKMLDSLEKNQQEIKNAKEELSVINLNLEKKVNERTKELEKLKDSLETKANKRTEELKKKVEELEKFQDLAIGRELKMIQLKKDIQELKSKQIFYEKDEKNKK